MIAALKYLSVKIIYQIIPTSLFCHLGIGIIHCLFSLSLKSFLFLLVMNAFLLKARRFDISASYLNSLFSLCL